MGTSASSPPRGPAFAASAWQSAGCGSVACGDGRRASGCGHANGRWRSGSGPSAVERSRPVPPVPPIVMPGASTSPHQVNDSKANKQPIIVSQRFDMVLPRGFSSRFAELVGVPRRTHHARLARRRPRERATDGAGGGPHRTHRDGIANS